MLPHRLAACTLVLAACGRLDFDARPDGASDSTANPVQPLSATLDTFTVQGATYVPAPVEMRIPPSPGTRWLVVMSAILESSIFLGPSVEVHYLVDGVERGIGGTENSAPARGGPWQHFVVLDGSETEQVVTFELRDAAGGTATMSNLEANAIQIPASSRYATFENVPIQLLTPTPFTPVVDFSLDGLVGDHILLLLVNASDRPGQSDAFIEWGGPSGERWLSTYQNSREPWQSVLTIERVQLTGTGTAQLRGWHNVGESTLRYPRVLALPLAEFPGSVYDNDVTYTNVTAPMVFSQLTPAVMTRSLYLASAWVEEDCFNTADAERVIAFFMDSAAQEHRHVTDNCAMDATYGMNRLFDTPAALYSVAMSVANGQAMIHHQSTQLLLALP